MREYAPIPLTSTQQCHFHWFYICEASLQKGPEVPPKMNFFVDLNRASHDISVKKISVLAQIFSKLPVWPIYDLHNFNKSNFIVN